MEPIRIALPKGRLLKETSALTAEAGWGLSDYSEGARLYHMSSACFPNMIAKIFHEKDIPIQVAMGNYDLGICGLDWIQELTVKYPGSGLVKVSDLGYGRSSLFLAASASSSLSSLKACQSCETVISIASEYPNLAESTALNSHFKRFNIFPLWGAAEIYPPENADLILISGKPGGENFPPDLKVIAEVLNSSAFVIANKNSWETKDLSEIFNTIYASIPFPPSSIPLENGIQGTKNLDTGFRRYGYPHSVESLPRAATRERNPGGLGTWIPAFAGMETKENMVRLALPDGHAQKHVVNILNKANIKIADYPSTTGNRRPVIEIPGVDIKVIRPQDMPLQVVNGKFDLAITGKDWVKEHLYKFPSSPLVELLDLKYSWVRIVAAVHNDVPANDIRELRQLANERGWRLRLASEYVSIADKYARDNHLGVYHVIPTWGATEAFVPDDADILIENTETGNTLKRHNLKIIETLFESTACLIANTESLKSNKAAVINSITALLKKAVEEK